MLRDKKFYNPISGDDLNESQFEEEILTFLFPTKFFLEMKSVIILLLNEYVFPPEPAGFQRQATLTLGWF